MAVNVTDCPVVAGDGLALMVTEVAVWPAAAAGRPIATATAIAKTARSRRDRGKN